MLNGERDGEGVTMWQDGAKYEGQWVCARLHSDVAVDGDQENRSGYAKNNPRARA